MELGRVGIWTFNLDVVPTARGVELAAEVEEMGYGAIWFPESRHEAFTNGMRLLAGTERIVVGSSIAPIWNHDAIGANAALRTVSEVFPERFVFGMGISHAVMVEGVRGERYTRPFSRMVEYLDAMDADPMASMRPDVPTNRMLAALGPKMLRLAAERTAGALPYFVPVEHTAQAREVMGVGSLLAVEQAVVLETDPTAARQLARGHMSRYLQLPNYTNNLRRLGWGDDDLDGEGSDRLVDAIVAWGDETAIAERVTAHHDAGADHVAVQVIAHHPTAPPVEEWRRLADALL